MNVVRLKLLEAREVLDMPGDPIDPELSAIVARARDALEQAIDDAADLTERRISEILEAS